MKIRPVGAELRTADGTDRHDEANSRFFRSLFMHIDSSFAIQYLPMSV